jgi:riboflavin synthase
MFTGIIESTGKVVGLKREESNLHVRVNCSFTQELKIDQSLAHNGVCLTVVRIEGEEYEVTAIQETLDKTNLGGIQVGDEVNLERCMPMNGRLDGHIVQGHVDTTAELVELIDMQGSWMLSFRHAELPGFVTVEKGSVCVNGISLTVVNSKSNGFSVAIIPYTWEHTNLKHLQPGSLVNVEFDILGKYVSKLLAHRMIV